MFAMIWVAAYLVGGLVKTAIRCDAIWESTGDYEPFRRAIIASIIRGPF